MCACVIAALRPLVVAAVVLLLTSATDDELHDEYERSGEMVAKLNAEKSKLEKEVCPPSVVEQIRGDNG